MPSLFAQTTNAPAQDNQPTMLPPVEVTDTNGLRENMPMGANQQPEWTARRRFAVTRVYVQPPWQVETEAGWHTTWPKEDVPNHIFQQEIELGLPHRFQFDVENGETIRSGNWRHSFNSVELRYALASWDKIPLNPVIGGEWKFAPDEPDAWELKLELGEAFFERLHWGANLNFERQVGGDREQELDVNQGLSYVLVDDKLSAGVEMQYISGSDKDSRGHPEFQFQLGPSFQWRPTRRVHVDVAPLFGITHDSPRAQLFVFIGFDFGRGSKTGEDDERYNPVSLRGK